MSRISPVSDDWVVKGCHVHVGAIEVALRPDHLGGIVCRKVFSTTADWEIDTASREVRKSFEDPRWRRKLRGRLEGAMTFLLSIEGELQDKARGRLREFRMILAALDRLEQT